MKVTIKRIDKSLPLPQYQTQGSVGFDFLARVSTKITSRGLAKIPANVIVKPPNGYMLMVASRGSTPFKKGLMLPHGVGIGDQDFCGENDEYLIPVYNFTDKDVIVERGERIAQGIFVKIAKATFNEVLKISSKSRGSFGSTD